MNLLVKQIVESNYLLEADNQKLIDMQLKIQEKIVKAKEKIDKYLQKFNKLIDKYKLHTEYHLYVPVDVMSNFKYVPYSEIKVLENKLGRHLAFPNNYIAYDMYKDAYDKGSPENLMHIIYWDYICKLDEICESIYRAENELKDLEKRNAEYVLKINHKISMESLVEELFKKIPELKEFIDSCAEKQYAFLTKQNKELEKAWEKYAKAKEDNEENYRKLLPQRFVLTEEQIMHEVKMWVKNESELLATRLTTEFGDIEKTSLYIGPGGNVNGYISGSKKSARIETIFAGGYNIQCLHTRLLIHEHNK